MATDFFQNQDTARRNTSRLVFLFALAVLALTVMLYALAVLLTGVGTPDPRTGEMQLALEWSQPVLLGQVAFATLALVAGGSLYKIAQLRGGGSVVAEALGGELLQPNTRDINQRRLLNVVEEMAIASGTPTPPVYLLNHEAGINAFAAGFTPGDAVIGVTRGCAEQLTRDELQGVVAHEFSHILNGDMRLNIRLMGVLHGILLIGILGYFLLRSSVFAGHGGRRSDRDNSAMAMLAAGVGLMVIGFLGSFFGSLIKASVSRQREFLADASAVQFTRNPNGIAGALKKIGGLDAGSLIESPNAPESSHLFFGQALRGGFQSLFATHPPLEERIARLDPSFDSSAAAPRAVGRQPAAAMGFDGGASATESASALDHIGQPTAAHIEYATALIRSLPTDVVNAAHEPFGARAVIYALVIDRDLEARRAQLDQLARFGEQGVDAETLRLLPLIEALDVRARLPLVDIVLPALRNLSPAQYQAFQSNLRTLVDADSKIDLFEWTLQRILLTHLRPHFERVRPARVRYSSLRKLAPECRVVLSILAYGGSPRESDIQRAFDQGSASLSGLEIAPLPRSECGLEQLDLALARLDQAAPSIKQRLLGACAACIGSDGRVTVSEGELLRAIADALNCPMPPLLPGQPLA